MKGLRTRLVVGVLGATVVVAALATVIIFISQSDLSRQRQTIQMALECEQQARALAAQPEGSGRVCSLKGNAAQVLNGR